MRHIIPQHQKRKIFDPRVLKRPIGKKDRNHIVRRETMFKNFYEDKKKTSLPRPLLWILVLIAAVLLVQSLFQLPLFKIHDIEISGLKYISSEDVRTFVQNELNRRRMVFFRNDNYFLVSLHRLRSRLEDDYLLTVENIAKKFPNTLTLTVQERIAGFVLQTPEQYIQIDSRGEWIGEVPGPVGNQRIIADERSEVGTMIPFEYLERVTQIGEAWDEYVPGLHILKFHLIDDETRIELSTDLGYRVYINPVKDFVPQLKRLAVFIQDIDRPDPGEYIDLRFDESLYIK